MPTIAELTRRPMKTKAPPNPTANPDAVPPAKRPAQAEQPQQSAWSEKILRAIELFRQPVRYLALPPPGTTFDQLRQGRQALGPLPGLKTEFDRLRAAMLELALTKAHKVTAGL